MPSVRELLETAEPRVSVPAAPPAEIRRLAGRRDRRGRVVGSVVGLAAVVLAGLVGVRVVQASDTAVTTPVSTPSPTRSSPAPVGTDLAALVGTQWVPDLVDANVSTVQERIGQTGPGPQAVLTFGRDHLLILNYSEAGIATTVRGRWEATGDSTSIDADTRGELRLDIAAPAGASETLAFLINRLSLTSAFAMWSMEPRPHLTDLRMVGYSTSSMSMSLDQVQPGFVLPPGYAGIR